MRLTPSNFRQYMFAPALAAAMPLLLLCSAAVPMANAARPMQPQLQTNALAEPGTYKVKFLRGMRCTSSGTMQNYSLYMPVPDKINGEGPFPTLLFIHGFLMTGEQHKNNAEFLAEHGFIVFAPDISKFLWGDDKRTRNVADLVDDLSWLTGRQGNQLEALRGKVDSSRLGVAGNSSGGAAALELALQAQNAGMPLRALVSMDGVPWDRTLNHIHELLPLKLLTLRAEPCACNYHSRMLKFLAELPFPYEDVKVNGARHCDVENPTTIGCYSVCGKSDAEHRLVFKTMLYLFLRDELSAPKIGAVEPSFESFVSKLQSEKKIVMEMNYPESHNRLLGSSSVGH